jgi:predicted ABC-type ATPase
MTMTNLLPPRIFVVAGAPAAGKTTFIQQQIQAGVLPADAFMHDCDAVMQGLKGYQDDLRLHGSAFAFSKWELLARDVAEEALFQAVERRQDIIYDRSCALMSSFTFIENVVKEKNYHLFFYYLEINIEIALQRASVREKETGRHTPAGVIEDRIKALQELLPQYQALAVQTCKINAAQ